MENNFSFDPIVDLESVYGLKQMNSNKIVDSAQNKDHTNKNKIRDLGLAFAYE